MGTSAVGIKYASSPFDLGTQAGQILLESRELPRSGHGTSTHNVWNDQFRVATLIGGSVYKEVDQCAFETGSGQNKRENVRPTVCWRAQNLKFPVVRRW